MHWIVQENVRDEASYGDFIQALQAQGVEYTVVKVIPFSHETIPDVNPEGRVLVWGSTTLDLVAKHKGWRPGTFLNDLFNQVTWTAMYGRENCLNGDAEFYEFCSIPAFEGVKFIRPVEDMKIFAGLLIHGEELQRWQQQALALKDDFSTLRPETIVSVSSPKEIETEWRYFVVDGKVVAGSQYRRGGTTFLMRDDDTAYEPWTFAQKMVDRWQPAKAFVLDIATVRVAECEDLEACPTYYDGCHCFHCKVIEVNCINSAGFYSADMNAVVAAIKALDESQKQW